MGKAPAFQFYVKDWLSDPQLRMAHPITRAIWIDMLCYMWLAEIRGELYSDIPQLATMTFVKDEDIVRFLMEGKLYDFCDIVTDDNGKITIRNRRMYRDFMSKENNKIRQRRYREKQKRNTKITPLSPSASAIQSKSNDLPSLENIENASLPKVREYLDKICDELYEREIFPKAHAWKNKMIKEKRNHRAVLHILMKCLIKRNFEGGDPWGWCTKIIQIEDGNFSEREYRKSKE